MQRFEQHLHNNDKYDTTTMDWSLRLQVVLSRRHRRLAAAALTAAAATTAAAMTTAASPVAPATAAPAGRPARTTF